MGSRFWDNNRHRRVSSASMIGCALLLFVFTMFGWAQTTIGTGSITGTVTDPSGAVVSDAKIVVTNINTNQAISLTSNASGAYTSGPLNPGTYKVQVSARGFSSVSQTLTVQVGNTVAANIKAN